jgi:hypothetical protein
MDGQARYLRHFKGKRVLGLNKSDYDRTAAEVQDFREGTLLPIIPEWKRFRSSWLEQSRHLFFIDLEFSVHSKQIYEVCVKDSNGKTVLNTVIDYRCSVQQLCDRNPNPIHHSVIRRIYGHPSPSEIFQTKMTIEQVADHLTKYFGPQTLLVEWSTSFCDYQKLSYAFKEIGKGHIMPPMRNVFRSYFAWRLALADFQLSLRLSDAYRLLRPEKLALQIKLIRPSQMYEWCMS